MVDRYENISSSVVFIDEPNLVRAIRAFAPDAHIVILPSDIFGSAPPHGAPRSFPKPAGIDATPANLTNREHAVLVHVATGETNAEIADAMGLARNTVKAYLQSLMRKLGARNRIEALAYARTYGMI